MIQLLMALFLGLSASALSSVDKAELFHQNIVPNASFVNGKAKWNLSTGSFIVLGSGISAFARWDAGALNHTLCTDLIGVPPHLEGKNGYFKLSYEVPSGNTVSHIVTIETGTGSTGNTPVLTTSTRPVDTTGNFIFPLSGTIQLCIEAQADEPSIDVFSASIGDALNLTQIEPQDVFSAKVSSTDVVTDENEDFINGNCTNATLGFSTCLFNSGFFTVPPNCQVSNATAGSDAKCRLQGDATASQVEIFCQTTVAVDRNFNLSCQKAGVDAPVQAFKADQTNRPWTAYTPTFTGFGTVTNIECYHSRQGENLKVRCGATTGTHISTEARFSFPSGLTSSSAIDALEGAGILLLSANLAGSAYILREPSVTYFTMGFSSSSNIGLAKKNGDVFSSSQNISFSATVRIQGWDETMNAPHVKFAVVSSSNQVRGGEDANITNSGTPTIADQSGDWIDSLVDNGLGDVTINIKAGVFSKEPNCRCTAENAGGTVCTMDRASTFSATLVRVQTFVSSTLSATDSEFWIKCEQDK